MADDFVTVSGKRFHHVWLRDNCLCQSCRDPHNFQKMFDISDHSHSLAPATVDVGEYEIEIVWDETEPHRSVFSVPWLIAHAYDHADGANSPAHATVAKRNSRQILWDRDWVDSHPLPRHDFKPTTLDVWTEQIATHGFAIISNVDDVIDLIRTVGPVRPTETGLTYDVGTLPADYGLSQTHRPLLPHDDYEIFMHTANLLQFLYCVENKAEGGDSILVDGFRVASDFRDEQPDHFRMLSEIPAQFEKFDAGSGLFNRRTRTVIGLDHRGEIEEVCFNNSHAWQWDIPFDQMQSYYEAYRAWFRAVKDPRYHYKFRLAPGDCYIVQGYRVLHSREAAVPNSGKRHMITAFTEADYLAGRRNFVALRHLFLDLDDMRASLDRVQEFRFTG